MVPNKSLDLQMQIIAALLVDVQTSHSEVLSPRAIKLTIQKMRSRVTREGMGFLTKALPRLGKAFDRALSGEVQLDSIKLAFKSLPNSKLPKFMGELFQLIFSHDGWVLPKPCVRSIISMRQIFGLFYKYELPYTADTEQAVIDTFVKNESEIQAYSEKFAWMANYLDTHPEDYTPIKEVSFQRIVRDARRLLKRVFSSFDHSDIIPRHGPGAVSTGERLWAKYRWTSVSPRVIESYPIDAFFYASLGAVCDSIQEIQSLKFEEKSAKVLLVPKDSRGPRLISCEPLTFQWVQQGLSRALSKHVERNPLTRFSVRFTDQRPNQLAALLGSETGNYATLDLKDASDRVSLGLVRLLFPEPLLSALLNCRSLSTRLPSGEILVLNKFAPMGSALCFPVMALTIWAILAAAHPDARVRRGLEPSDDTFVYGDDVIVPTAQAANAIKLLEAFGLKVNRDKSCISGFFRESCGVDAFKGVEVTPVRIRTVWSSSPCPESFTSWLAYANQFYGRKCFNVYNRIVKELVLLYGPIPCVSMRLACPSLIEAPEADRTIRSRVNKRKTAAFQRPILEYRVLTVRSRPIKQFMTGWRMLLRYFVEASSSDDGLRSNDTPRRCGIQEFIDSNIKTPFSVSSYTKRKSSSLTYQWISNEKFELDGDFGPKA